MATRILPERPRRYRGSSAAERRAERRERLIRAAVEVYGERGFRNATVKAVCEAAGLTERYFYESFENSEALLAASYRAVTGMLLKDMEAAARAAPGRWEDRIRAILACYFEALRRSPAPARVFLVEVRGVSPAVDEAFAESLEAFGALLAGRSAPEPDCEKLLRAGVVGGVIHVALTWIDGGYARPVEQVVRAASRLCRVLAGPLSEGQ